MKRISIAFTISAALLGAACGSKKQDEGGGAAGKSVEAKAGPTKLPKLGLQLDVPGDVNVGDAIMGEGNSVQGSEVGSMQVEVFKDPQTIAQAKDDAAMYNPKNEKEETLPDGWVLTYENTGAAGTNYWVTVRRDIGGKTYKCWTTGSEPGQASAVAAACKSLRK